MQITNHILENLNNVKIKFIESPNHGEKFLAGVPDTIIIHYTAGSSASSSIKTLCDDKVANRASAHLVVSRDASITQLVPFNLIAWHAGKSQHQNRIGLNQFSIGIEIDNAGELTKIGDKFISWFGKEYPPQEVAHLKHRNQDVLKYWHTFTEDQIITVFNICEFLAISYPIRFILGHEEISPVRKVDPGPAFPLDKLRDRILNKRNDDSSEDFQSQGKVIAKMLNLRQAPVKGEVIVKLPKETKVNILEEKEGWYKVATEQVGWVKKEFVGTL